MTASSGAFTLNGEAVPLREETTVASVVAELVASPDGCAVARNGVVLPRSSWAAEAVKPGDRLEVLGAVAGG
ncbi:MAG TPA: sulfur carrier protein ThiS [Acidimicrobiales bacterium]|nr:sulfur carrier protein ThiS [Acidimicrobiales bacterium]